MSYGTTGKRYKIGDNEIFIDDKFIVATLMSITVFMQDALRSVIQLPEGVGIDNIIEGMASAIYDSITENESENAGEPTSTTEK